MSLVKAGATGVFVDSKAGTNKTITTSGFAITGTDSAFYTLEQPTTTANITAKAVSVKGLTAKNKTYDRTTTVTLEGTAVLDGIISGDTVSLSGTRTATVVDANVGTDKPVTISGNSLSGADGPNYTPLPPLQQKVILQLVLSKP